jgi:hypothetical protein
MKNQSFFVITKKDKYGYGSDQPILWFIDLDRAMEVFKLLIGDVSIDITSTDIPKIKKEGDQYIGTEELHYIRGEGDYKIESRHIKIYTLEEIELLKKEREEMNK